MAAKVVVLGAVHREACTMQPRTIASRRWGTPRDMLRSEHTRNAATVSKAEGFGTTHNSLVRVDDPVIAGNEGPSVITPTYLVDNKQYHRTVFPRGRKPREILVPRYASWRRLRGIRGSIGDRLRRRESLLLMARFCFARRRAFESRSKRALRESWACEADSLDARRPDFYSNDETARCPPSSTAKQP